MEALERRGRSSRLGACPLEAYEAAWPGGRISDLRMVNPQSVPDSRRPKGAATKMTCQAAFSSKIL